MYLKSITLSKYFSFEFSVRAMLLPQQPGMYFNLLDVVNQAGESLFSFHVGFDATLEIFYNNVVVSTGTLNVDDQGDWTALAITTTPSGVNVYSALGYTEYYDVPNVVVDTANKIYKIFTSNDHDTSANAHVTAIVIQGKAVFMSPL